MLKLRLVHAPPTYSAMLWRISPGRSRRSLPAGFILPCQPLLVARPPAGPGWLHEIKRDGYRLLARKEADRVHLWTRYGTDFTDRFPKIAEAVRSLPAESALIDGEAVAFRLDGHSDFAALRTKGGGAMACLVAFDLLNLDGEGLRQRRIEERRDKLARLVHGVDGILFSEALAAEGALVFAKACEMGLEGIVSKRVGSRYWSGRSRHWLKSKNPAFLRG
jgi:bifunctional non-homologous end joining protein LigD